MYHGKTLAEEGHMAVYSNTFGGLQLSGEDAKKFRDQTRSANNSAAARSAASNGVAAAKALLSSGQVKVAKRAG